MSYVSAFMNNNFATLMSDGQVTDEFGEIVDTKFKKIIKLNGFILGFTGNASAYKLVKRALEECEKILFIDFKLMLEICCLTFKKINEDYPEVKNSIVMMGYENRKPNMYIIESDENGVSSTDKSPELSKYSLITITPDDYKLEDRSDGKKLNDMILENINNNNEDAVAAILESQKIVNDYVSDNSKTVNKVVFSEVIKNR